MALLGIDVSRHQGTVNWQAVKDAGNVYAFCKATDGTSYPYVGYYRTQAPLIRAAGLVLGAYHWLQPGDGAAQARYFVSVVGDFNGVLAVVDYERNPSGTYASPATLRAFVNEFRRLTGGHTLIVYTGHWFWVTLLKNPFGADIGPLWHSEYETTDAEIADGPELDFYGGWPGATFWQYTSSGQVPGVSGSCDRNLFYGTQADLLILAGGSVTPPVPPVIPTVEDLMPFPVIASPGRGPYTALLPGKIIRFTDDPLPASTDVETWAPSWAYFEGVNAGFFENKVDVSDAQFDQRVAIAQQYTRLPAAVTLPPVEVTVDVDEEAIAAEVVEQLDVEAIVRDVFADAGQE